MSDWRRGVGAGLAGVAAGWALRHVTSPAVRGWSRPTAGQRRRAGPLAVRDTGGPGPATVLLHGLTANGDTWGGGYDRMSEGGRLVVPDLLGFGDSMHAGREGFSLTAHLDALDEMAHALGLDDEPLTVVGHSMGAALGLHWAARRSETHRVVGICAPLYRDAHEADNHIRGMGALERLFALESPLAHGICELMCDFRGVAQWIAVLISPQWPVPVARRGVQHTWPSYLGGMNGIIRDGSWQHALAELDRRAVAVLLAEGADDPVPVAGLADQLARTYTGVTTRRHPRAGHDLPFADPQWCRRLLQEYDGDASAATLAGRVTRQDRGKGAASE